MSFASASSRTDGVMMVFFPTRILELASTAARTAGLADAADSRWMRTEHNRVAAFERNEGLIDCGRRRIRRRNDCGDHADRAGDLEYFLLLVFADDADGFHRTNGAINV